MSYIGNSPVLHTTEYREEHTVTGSPQNLFNTLGYAPGYISVYRNGVRLAETEDFLATDGASVLLNENAEVGDIIAFEYRTEVTPISNNSIDVSKLNLLNDSIPIDAVNVTANSISIEALDGQIELDKINITADSISLDSIALTENGIPISAVNTAGLSANTAVIEGSSSGDLVRITQTGSGNALVVEDSANPDSTPFVVDANGNVGIGTSSPGHKLTVAGYSNVAAANKLAIGDNADFQGLIHMDSATETLTIENTSDYPGRATIFKDNGTERMRIDSSGATRFGDTFVGDAWSINSGIFSQLGSSIPFAVASDSIVAVFNRHSTTGTVVEFKQGIGTAVGKIDVTASSTSYLTSSDYRLKENITEITDGITRVKQLNPSRFNFIADPDRIVDGFLAHEVQDIVPEAITGEKDAVNEDGSINPQGIDQSKLIPLLTAALQESIALIESQQSQIDALTARIETGESNGS